MPCLCPSGTVLLPRCSLEPFSVRSRPGPPGRAGLCLANPLAAVVVLVPLSAAQPPQTGGLFPSRVPWAVNIGSVLADPASAGGDAALRPSAPFSMATALALVLGHCPSRVQAGETLVQLGSCSVRAPREPQPQGGCQDPASRAELRSAGGAGAFVWRCDCLGAGFWGCYCRALSCCPGNLHGAELPVVFGPGQGAAWWAPGLHLQCPR